MSWGVVMASAIAAIASMIVAAVQSRRAIHQRLDSLAGVVEQHVEHWDDFHSRGWNNLPEGSENAVQLVVTLTNLSSSVDHLNQTVDLLREELAEHVAWEMSHKYGQEK